MCTEHRKRQRSLPAPCCTTKVEGNSQRRASTGKSEAKIQLHLEATLIHLGTESTDQTHPKRNLPMPVVMHFATFLKFLTLNSGDKIRDLEKYAKPGGFDFYRPSRDGVLQYAVHGRTQDQVLKDISKTSSTNSEERNKEIFERVAAWMDKHQSNATMPNRGVWRSPNSVFSVHIEPEIAYEHKGVEHVVAVYPRKDVRLNRDQAGAGLILLRRGYGDSKNEKFGILDAFANKVHWTPTNVSERLLDNEIGTMESELSGIMP